MILERNKHAPALLFENIPNSRQDMQILCSQIDGIERLALAMGTDPKVGITEFMNYPAASCGVSKAHPANASHSVTPEFFSPGSRSGLAWIPA